MQILEPGIAKTLLRHCARYFASLLSTSGWVEIARAISPVIVSSD
jgi:hypothetical protein